jgi:anti-sigma B factor antagonist
MAYFTIEALPSNTQRVAGGGEIDLHAKGPFQRYVERALAARPERLVFDLSEATFLDSTGISILVGANRRLRETGGRVEIVCSSPNVLRVFEIAGLERVFPIHETLEGLEALERVPA